jgi:AcrR family transcriptional regulator
VKSERPQTVEARERVLRAAEHLFMERGYSAVTLRDVAGALGMRQASLYYHAPGGKYELFVTVTERVLARHQAGVEAALQAAHGDLRTQLRSVAHWYLSQPAMDWGRMVRSDMPNLEPVDAQRLMTAAGNALIHPVARAIRAAEQRGDIARHSPETVAGSLLAVVSAVSSMNSYFSDRAAEDVADEVVDVLIDGLRPRTVGDGRQQAAPDTPMAHSPASVDHLPPPQGIHIIKEQA